MAVDTDGACITTGTASGRILTLDARMGMLESSWIAHDGEIFDLVALGRERVVSSAGAGSVALLDTPSRTAASRCRLPHADAALSVAMVGKDAVVLQTHNRLSVLRDLERQPPVATAESHRLRQFRGGAGTVMRAMPLNQWLLIGSESGPVSLWA